MDGSPPRAAPAAAGASAGPACSLDDSDGEPLPGRTSTLRRGQAQVLQSPGSSANQAHSDSPSAGPSSRKRKVCMHFPCSIELMHFAMSGAAGTRMQLWCWPSIKVRTWQPWGQAHQGPARSPDLPAGCVRVLMHFLCEVQQAQAASPGTGSSSRKCKACNCQAKSLLVYLSI